ncbi:hypothetical protein ACLOJK_005403 [Asimina triloba]
MVPEISLIGCSTISGSVDGFSVVAADADTLTGAAAGNLLGILDILKPPREAALISDPTHSGERAVDFWPPRKCAAGLRLVFRPGEMLAACAIFSLLLRYFSKRKNCLHFMSDQSAVTNPTLGARQVRKCSGVEIAVAPRPPTPFLKHVGCPARLARTRVSGARLLVEVLGGRGRWAADCTSRLRYRYE